MGPCITETPSYQHGDGLKEVFPHIEDDPTTLPSSLDPFTVTTSTGFLPLRPPQTHLPSDFEALIRLVEDLPVTKADGTPGLLATYQLGLAIDNHTLPDLDNHIDTLTAVDGKPDLAAVTTVFREYAFIASAYLLEPCWERQCKALEGYGLGRQMLPKCIAGPLVKTAKMLDIHPFMAYAAAYCLYNYRFEDQVIGASEYSNLRLIRAFERGLDPSSSEAGFVLTHLDMVKHSRGLISGTCAVLNAIGSTTGRSDVVFGLTTILETMQAIETSMETMWANSKPKDYNTYRPFIFGITNQSMFPKGVIYEGVNDNEPLFFRGESGANDSIIPLLDGVLQIPMPQNPLTDILKDFRSYRPKPHRDFLAYVRDRSEELAVRDYCCEDAETAVLYLRLLDHVRSFRWRHWLFAREYIIRRSSHPTATGGSPIITWLPNQLFAVMDLMSSVWEGIDLGHKEDIPRYVFEMMENIEEQRSKLQREVERWCKEREVTAR
ncbi:hypothetical protein LTR37_010372 [Vermiconidia calcicola]|uniref:Uncharacterized protein n=1 Tax=Vermiconidia calcicola TaxID=1690605 RepID=A0ACC3N6D9_9PEZI|nr:hypothetical protein LTR37_010372 [Vermiconidia calcicola]